MNDLINAIDNIVQLPDNPDNKLKAILKEITKYPEVMEAYTKGIIDNISDKEEIINELRVLLNEYAGFLIIPKLFKGVNRQFHIDKIKEFNQKYPNYSVHIGELDGK